MHFSLTDVRLHKLDNGLKLITREDHSTPLVTSMIWYNVGARHEAPGSTGLSHFVEHLLFKGTRRFAKGEIDLITTRNGGHNNAFTGHDYTAYYFSFASDRWETALEIESDRMVNALFDPREIELERQVILEELALSLDDPWEVMHRRVDAAAFPAHPYGIPVIGRAEDVESLTAAALARHYRSYYVPNNATLVIVGDFETRRVVAQVERLFGAIAPGSLPEPPSFEAAGFPSTRSISLSQPSGIHRMLIGLPAPSIRSPLFAPYCLVNMTLTEGKLSRLYQRLVEREQLVSVIHSDLEETLDPYLNNIRLEFNAEVSHQDVEDAVFEELERLGRQPLSELEFQRARNQCAMEFLGDLETTFDQAYQIGVCHLFGVPEACSSFLEQIDRQSPQTVLEVAAQTWSPEQVVVCHQFPE